MSFPCELSAVEECRVLPHVKQQCTLRQTIILSGTGLFTGQHVTMRLCPAEAGTGIVFKRTDLPHKPLIEATLTNVVETPRSTVLGNEWGCVRTVEHLLAALRGCGVDNLCIEISGSEVPIFDGSAQPFVSAIEEAEVLKQDCMQIPWKFTTPFFWSEGGVHLVALPADELSISYTLHYPHSPFLGSQYYSVILEGERFKREIAPCRTFSLYEEIAPLLERGLIKGGTLDSGILIKGNEVVNSGGLRFPDETVRHKILDVVGDISLIGSFTAHIIAIRSGHASNIAFARGLLNHIKLENF